MKWTKVCFDELSQRRMFDSSMHRSRFRELQDCYESASFFTKGLYKCMYLSCWDEEHFLMILEMLNEMTLGRERQVGLEDMKEQGKFYEEEMQGDDVWMMELSSAFLDNMPFLLPADANVTDQGRHIIEQALEAARVIDIVYSSFRT